jgi:amino acid transporter
MIFSIALLLAVLYIAWRIAPREKKEHALVHGAGQVGLAAAVALFGVDYFTSFYYASGEMMSALHPYGLQQYGYIAVAVIAFANFAFGALYMFSLGVFNQGGGAYTAAMRYLLPTLSLVVAVVLIQDYIFTIVVSALSGADQLLSVLNAYGIEWVWHFVIGASLAAFTFFMTIRGRGESAQMVFTLLAGFIMLTVAMTIGLTLAHINGVPAVPYTEPVVTPTLGQAAYHMLTASMKGMVALSGLEAMSDGIQFLIKDDPGFVKWGKQHLPKLKGLWGFYSGKAGIGRAVQTSFLFYGGVTTLILTTFAIRFDVFDGTLGRTLVGNLAFIGFGQFPGGEVLYWAYQLLAVALLAAASMTAFQDLQAVAWRDVASGEMPEVVVYRNQAGTFTRSVTAGFIVAVIIMLLVRGQTTMAVPFYGVGVFMPITVMGLAIRRHILRNFTGRARFWGSLGASVAAALGAIVFVGQIVGKWQEGGWVVLISFSVLALGAHALLLSPIGYRKPKQIHRIVRDKARVQGAMASIVEWESLTMQQYRYGIRSRALMVVTRFFEIFGVRRPVRFELAEAMPAAPGTYEAAAAVDRPDAPSLLTPYLQGGDAELEVGGHPKQTAPGETKE